MNRVLILHLALSVGRSAASASTSLNITASDIQVRSEECANAAMNALQVLECALSPSSTESASIQQTTSRLPAVVTVTVITTISPTAQSNQVSNSVTISAQHKEVDGGDDSGGDDGTPSSENGGGSPATSSCDGEWLTSAGIDGQGEHFSTWCERTSHRPP